MRREITMLICIIFTLMTISLQNPSAFVSMENIEQSVAPKPIGDIRLFLIPEFTSSGTVAYAKDISIADFHILEIMYYNASYGTATVKGILKTITNDRVLSIHAYGFKGNLSWNGTVENTFIQAEGTANVLMIAHQ